MGLVHTHYTRRIDRSHPSTLLYTHPPLARCHSGDALVCVFTADNAEGGEKKKVPFRPPGVWPHRRHSVSQLPSLPPFARDMCLLMLV